MTDEQDCEAAPTPLQRSRHCSRELPSSLQAGLATLRGTEVYVRVLCDRFELAQRSEPIQRRVSLDVLHQLIAASAAFQRSADQTLQQLDPRLAERAMEIAEMTERAEMARRRYVELPDR